MGVPLVFRFPGCLVAVNVVAVHILARFVRLVALIVRNAYLHRELSEANTFLHNLIHSAADAIIALDPDGRVVTWNPSAERILMSSRATCGSVQCSLRQ